MTLSLHMVTIDCAEPRKLAEFWTEALNTSIVTDAGDGAYLILAPPTPGSAALGLQRVPEPKVGKNRAHIDLGAEDRAAEVARLVGLGATAVADHTVPGYVWTVLTDPDGNEFCVGQPAETG